MRTTAETMSLGPVALTIEAVDVTPIVASLAQEYASAGAFAPVVARAKLAYDGRPPFDRARWPTLPLPE
jgi:hypothetical protein